MQGKTRVLVPLDKMCRPLWIGGGISRDALTVVAGALHHLATQHTGAVGWEITNLANAASAELTKTPTDVRMSGPIPSVSV